MLIKSSSPFEEGFRMGALLRKLTPTEHNRVEVLVQSRQLLDCELLMYSIFAE